MRQISIRIATIISLALSTAIIAVPASAQSDSPAPFPIGHKISRFVQTITGMSAVSAFVASQATTIALEHKLGGNVKAKIKSYSMTDLLAGKVRSVELTFKDPKVHGVQLGYLHVIAQNPIWFNFGKHKDTKAGVNSSVMLTLDGCMTQKEITSALQDPIIASMLSTMKLDLPGLGGQQLEILEPNVQMENGKITIKATLVTKGAKLESGVPIIISATPYMTGDGAKLCLKDMAIQSSEIENPVEFAKFVTELFNPLINFSRMDKVDHALRLNDCKISDNKINFSGKLILAPRKVNSAVAQKANPTK